jgi:protein SCO1/2
VARKLVNYTLPPVTIVDQRGNRMSLPELLDTDQPIMVNFIFTTCTAICPMMSSIFQQVQMKLGADAARVRMISVSIDPEQDTPEALQEYAQRFRAGPEWYFITGTLEDSIAIQQAFDAYRGDKMNHAPLTLMREARGDEWVRYDGFATAEQLAEDCRRLL